MAYGISDPVGTLPANPLALGKTTDATVQYAVQIAAVSQVAKIAGTDSVGIKLFKQECIHQVQ